MNRPFMFANVSERNNYVLDMQSKCPCCDKRYATRFFNEVKKVFVYKHSFLNRKTKVTNTHYHESLR